MIRINTDIRATAIIAAILIMLIASVMGLTAASLLGTDTAGSQNYMNSQQAFFIAEAGLECYLKQLQGQTSSWAIPPTKPVNETLGKGSFSITTANEQADRIDISSTSTLTGIGGETITRTVTVAATRKKSVPQAFYYVQHSGNNIRFNRSTEGTVTGDISAANNVTGEDEMTINGTVTENSSVDFPEVDFSGYQAIADYVITGNFTFQQNQTYNGIYYITGDADFQDRVTLNGSLICPSSNKKIDMNDRDRITITPGGNNPALVAAGDILIRSTDRININGLVYSQGSINLRDMVRSNFNGTLICNDNMNVRETRRVNLTYNPDIVSNPPPYFEGGGQTVATSNWNEVY